MHVKEREEERDAVERDQLEMWEHQEALLRQQAELQAIMQGSSGRAGVQ